MVQELSRLNSAIGSTAMKGMDGQKGINALYFYAFESEKYHMHQLFYANHG